MGKLKPSPLIILGPRDDNFRNDTMTQHETIRNSHEIDSRIRVRVYNFLHEVVFVFKFWNKIKNMSC